MVSIETVAAGMGFSHELALALEQACIRFGINTELRVCHFLAQVAHESGTGRWLRELWGPTPAQSRYEGRKDLGNVHAGDGVRYKGRGPIQLTGRANYRKYGQQLGIDLENNPEIVALPSMGLMVACKFWSDNGLNALADKDDVVAVTRRINGGTNGLEDRKKHLALLRGWI